LGKTDISSKTRNEAKVFTLSTLTQQSALTISQRNRQEMEIKGMQTGKLEVKLSALNAEKLKQIL
jgi:hypothetical protein